MPHLEWIQETCRMGGIEPVLPLWNRDQDQIISEFLDAGFITLIIAVRADVLGEEWLGRTLDRQFIEDIKSLDKEITPCGEAGEFHSLVVDGPIFKNRLHIVEAAKVRRENHWFLDIRRCELISKSGGK
jgi:diphthine-ammonia ligase